MIIVQEAGGKVTDINGKALDFSRSYQLTENSGVVATNGLLHDAFIDAIKKV
jgi:3'(2'), 5'-bisphosphate nucleotidase